MIPAILLFLALASQSFTQNSTNVATETPSQTVLPSSATPSANETAEEVEPEADVEKACKRGTKVGTFQIIQPNSSTMWFIGRNYTIKWKYSLFVKKKPQTIDIKLQEISNGIPVTWKRGIAY
jgi:hypothetical protein